ncbi:MAG: hypothetical protein IJK97_00075, partial [Thermoguttaceae bacterium]|nr:hypothetical protein [Thermoguttaceae bacterium]
MSRSVDYQYELQRRRREEIRQERIRETTQSFLDRYTQTLQDLQAQGLAQYVQAEWNSAARLVANAQSYLYSDPDSARDYSQQAGELLRGIYRLARSIQNDTQRAERERARQQEALRRQQEHEERLRRQQEEREARLAREKQLQEEDRARIQAEIQLREAQRKFAEQVASQIREALQDRVAFDLAGQEAEELEKKFLELSTRDGADLTNISAQFQTELQALSSSAIQRAEAWRQKKREERQTENLAEQIELKREVLTQNKAHANNEELRKIAEKLNQLKQDVSSGKITQEAAAEQLAEAETNADEAVCSEEYRRETLKAIVQTLRSLGFIFTCQPTIQGPFIKLEAKRPNGQRSVFLVSADGAMRYSFDQYEGQTCKKDIQEVMV